MRAYDRTIADDVERGPARLWAQLLRNLATLRSRASFSMTRFQTYKTVNWTHRFPSPSLEDLRQREIRLASLLADPVREAVEHDDRDGAELDDRAVRGVDGRK